MTSKVKNHFSQAYFDIIYRFFQLLVMSIWSCHMAKPYMASHAWQAMHGKAIYGKAMHGKAMHGKAMHGKAMRSLPRPRPLFAIET